MTRKHIVITGTGRAGTTFLVQLLTRLGLDTGYSVDSIGRELDKVARAGLEHDIRREGSPYVVKSPAFCEYAAEVVSRKDIQIDHVFVPIRDLEAAAESRRHVQGRAIAELSPLRRLRQLLRPVELRGGLILTRKKKEQEMVLLHKIYRLVLDLSTSSIPVTFLRYPLLTSDAGYLYAKLRSVVPGVELEKFEEAFRMTVRPELVHKFTARDA